MPPVEATKKLSRKGRRRELSKKYARKLKRKYGAMSTYNANTR